MKLKVVKLTSSFASIPARFSAVATFCMSFSCSHTLNIILANSIARPTITHTNTNTNKYKHTQMQPYAKHFLGKRDSQANNYIYKHTQKYTCKHIQTHRCREILNVLANSIAMPTISHTNTHTNTDTNIQLQPYTKHYLVKLASQAYN